MPPTGYLTTTAIEQCLVWLNTAYPSFTQLLPFGNSELGRPIRAIRIRSGGGERNGALLIGGTHAGEVINPDLLVGLAFKLCWAYDNNLGLTFGAKQWSKTDVRLLVDGMDIFIVPNINPDGREYVQTHGPAYYEWWRKNRGTNADGTTGADINRNYDFLWQWTIGNTSSVSTAHTYKGDAAFSERETRNVQDFLNAHPQITCFVDVHSYSELILYPWGDDDNQSADTSKNFRNPVWNGLRGALGDAYGEYIPAVDEAKYVDRANKIRDAIAAVRGRRYKVEQGFDLYGTSGASSDYAYSRFFRGAQRKIWAFSIETNRGPRPDDNDPLYGFRPPIADALLVMEEVQSGLIQFMLSCVCLVTEIGRRRFPEDIFDGLRVFRDGEMAKGRRGRRWIDLLDTHGDELLVLLAADSRARETAEQILGGAVEIVLGREGDEPPTIDRQLAARVERLGTRLEKKASPQLRRALDTVRKDARAVVGKTARQAIR